MLNPDNEEEIVKICDNGCNSTIANCTILPPSQDNKTTFCIVSSPMNNSIYDTRGILMNVVANDTSRKLDKIELIDPFYSKPRTLCKNCKSYQKNVGFNSGSHEIIVRCTYSGKIEDHSINFTNDYTTPRVANTKPMKNSVVRNGLFVVKYTEENPLKVTLHYGVNKTSKEDCPAGRNQECIFNVDLSRYDNNDINYWFEIKDIAGNTAESRPTRISVDIL